MSVFNKLKFKQRGYSGTEIVVGVLVAGVVAGAAVAGYQRANASNENQEIRNELRDIGMGFLEYQRLKRELPSDNQTTGSFGLEKMDALGLLPKGFTSQGSGEYKSSIGYTLKLAGQGVYSADGIPKNQCKKLAGYVAAQPFVKELKIGSNQPFYNSNGFDGELARHQCESASSDTVALTATIRM